MDGSVEKLKVNGLDEPFLTQDEKEFLEVYRKAKRLRFADIEVTIQEGVRVKLWITQKLR